MDELPLYVGSFFGLAGLLTISFLILLCFIGIRMQLPRLVKVKLGLPGNFKQPN